MAKTPKPTPGAAEGDQTTSAHVAPPPPVAAEGDQVASEHTPPVPVATAEGATAEPVSAAAEDTRPRLRVSASSDTRWRGGLRFGRAPVDLTDADIAAAAAARGLDAEAFVALLIADPELSVVGIVRD